MLFMEAIRVLVVDPHALFRAGVVSILQRQVDFEVVGEALDGIQAVQDARHLQPDIVLMDVQTPGLGGLEAARQIKKVMPSVKIVLFTSVERDAELFEAIRIGVLGYIPKRIEPEGLCRTLRSVFQGEAAISGTCCARLFEAFAGLFTLDQVHSRESPSPREQEILELLATGASNKEIAGRLYISEYTVKSHLRNVMAKLNLENRVQVAAYTLRRRHVWQYSNQPDASNDADRTVRTA
jgi:two-component system nitrate/nitrite response regulator NarL